MKVLVFGANGLVGTWTVVSLLNSKIEVVAVSQNINRIKNIESLSLKVHSSASDNWEDILIRENPDVIIHCDWSGVAASEKDSWSQTENLQRWTQLAFIAKRIKVSKVIYLGSQAEFGHKLSSVNTKTPFSPVSNYGRAKVAANQQLQAIYEGSNTKFVWARLFSIYGALDEGSWLVPSTIRSLLAGKIFNLSSGAQRWNYLHVSDVATAITALALETYEEETFNIGARQTVQVAQIAKTIAQELNSSNLLRFGQEVDNPIVEVNPDINPVLNLGWAPHLELDVGLLKTVDWFRMREQEFTEYGFSNINIGLPKPKTIS